MAATPRRRIVCTTCCKEKRRDEGLLPAIDRYQSPRIRSVALESRRLGLPLFILSGRFGLLASSEEIPWYDEVLAPERVSAVAERIVARLDRLGITDLVLFACPRSTPGWAPYYAALETACASLGVEIEIREVGREVQEDDRSLGLDT